MTTQTQFKSAIRALGFIVSVEDGEYRVTLPVRCYGGDSEAAETEAYYTNDGQDALDTAKQWRNGIS